MLKGSFRWGYLIYLGFYLLPVLLQPPVSGWHWVGIIAALLAFLALFYQLERQEQASSTTKRHRPWLLLGFGLIASVATPLNSGSMAMFAYVGFFLGFWYQGRQFILPMLVLLGWQALLMWASYPTMWLQGYALVVVLGVSINGVIERLRWQQLQAQEQHQTEVQLLALQLDRERIARDLHDLLGHSLASIALKAELVELLLKQQQPEAARQQLQELQQLSRDSLQQVRTTISGYRQQGLAIVLPQLLSQLESSGWYCQLDLDVPTLMANSPPDLELMLTELCTNLIKHSNGKQLRLSAAQQGDYWHLQLQEDGDCQHIQPGDGLMGIQSRLQSYGGNLCWQLAPTCFTLRWPVGIAGSPQAVLELG